jgi:cadmium resistance protein CadD (predicted permease)
VGSLFAAAGIFIGTNVDDLIVLTVLFLSARAAGRPPWRIWAGQYLGIGVLVGVSLLAALGLTLVPDRWVPLLGLVPLGLGLWGLISGLRDRGADDSAPVSAHNVFAVAGITIANGADNIAVYTPVFRTMDASGAIVLVAVFAVLVAVWCMAASWLGSHGG